MGIMILRNIVIFWGVIFPLLGLSANSGWVIKGDVIEVHPPDGALQVRILEVERNSTHTKQLLVGHLPKDSSGKLYFKSPKTVRLDQLKFEWISHDPFPFSFYEGRSKFNERLTIDSDVIVEQFSSVEESMVILDDQEKWEAENETFRQNTQEEEVSLLESIAGIDARLPLAETAELDQLLELKAVKEESLIALNSVMESAVQSAPLLSNIQVSNDLSADYLTTSSVLEPLLLRSDALLRSSAIQSEQIFEEPFESNEETDSTEPAEEISSDSVQETDIWHWAGDFLYFFNQKRGLQIIDLSNPEDPVVVARYRQPASGEQMYVSEDGSLIYLIINRFNSSKSKLKILKFEGSQIIEQSETELPGNYRESRLIGNVMHLVCQETSDTVSTYYWRNWDYQQTTKLLSLDIEDPQTPKQIFEETIAGRAEVLFANNQYLIVITSDLSRNYHESHVAHTFALNEGNSPVKKHTISIGGRVRDKFKIHTFNGVLTIVSQARKDSWQIYSLLENFDLKTGNKLGSLDIAERETLYATRFQGNYAYIVTFLRVDPLFIIDLSSPQEPRIISELKVPGWSEYLQVFNDQLFAIGTEDSLVTASLFDISDKENPFLASRVFLGEKFGYSSSEANYDEKAIGQVPELGLFLIPFETHSYRPFVWEDDIATDAYYPSSVNAVQILQHSENELIERGQIDYAFQSRRATIDHTGKYMFSISAEELVVSDITNLDDPLFVTNLQLAWQVDQINASNEALFQFTQPAYGNDKNATVTLSPIDNPDHLLSVYDLGKGRIVGSLFDQGMLHIAQIEKEQLVAKTLKFDDSGNLLDSAVCTIPLLHKLSNQKFIPISIGDNQICWASELTKEELTYFTHSAGHYNSLDPFISVRAQQEERRSTTSLTNQINTDNVLVIGAAKELTLSESLAIENTTQVQHHALVLTGELQVVQSNLSIARAYYPIPRPITKSCRLLGELHLLRYSNENEVIELNHASSIFIEKSGGFISASGPFQSGKQVLYGFQSKFDKNVEYKNNLNKIIDDASSKIASNQALIAKIFMEIDTLKEELLISTNAKEMALSNLDSIFSDYNNSGSDQEELDYVDELRLKIIEKFASQIKQIEDLIESKKLDIEALGLDNQEQEKIIEDARLSLSVPQFYKSSKLLRYDLSGSKIEQLVSLDSPGKIIGTKGLNTYGETSLLYFENDDIETGNFHPSPLNEFYLPDFYTFDQSLAACSYDGINIYLLDEIRIPNTKEVSVGDEFIFVTTAQEEGDQIEAYSIDLKSGKLLKQFDLFEKHQSQVYNPTSKGKYTVSFSEGGVYIFDGQYEWTKHSPELETYHFSKNWTHTDSSVLFPVGQYGVEIVSSNTETLTLPDRRVGDVNSWQDLPDSAVSIFADAKSPLAFSNNDFKGWKFRPETQLDQNSTTFTENWKELDWFGSFYDRSYPWVFHLKLGWFYHHHENNSKGFWIWHEKLGWIWTNKVAHPYFFSQIHEDWIYLNFSTTGRNIRYYSFRDSQWLNL